MTKVRALRLAGVAVVWWLIAAGAVAAQTLVARGSTWRYLDNGAAPGPGWMNPGYDDQLWPAGPAQLGYGDGDEATVIGYGGNPNAKAITTYFRRTFNLADAGAVGRLDLNLLRDDGAVVYLNGIELRRDNLPAGPIDAATLALVAIGGADESTFFPGATDASALRSGANVIAVEVHQSSPTSSDVSFDLELIASTGGATVTRGPYLQRGTPTGVVVRWRTDLPTDSRVRYGPPSGPLASSAGSASIVTEHVVALTGLTADTAYGYSVGTSTVPLAGGDAAHVFRTAPAAGIGRRTRVWVVGDVGIGGAPPARVRDAYLGFAGGVSPDLWLMLGDNAYNSGTDAEYQVGVFDVYQTPLRSSVLWPTLGNHDGISADSATQSGPYYDIFSLPAAAEAGGVASGTEAYYSFDYGRIHFVCLDSYDSSRAPSGPMLQWLAGDLHAAHADWIIAFWHHPPYSKGSHDSDIDVELTEMRQNALPVLEQGGVDLVLSGHSHDYERSVLLDGHYGLSTTLQAMMVRDGGDGRVEGDGPYHKATTGAAAHEGAVYAVVGSSARTGGGPLNHPAMRTSLNELGSLVLDVEGAVLTGRFLDDLGRVRDGFTLTKGTVSTATLQGDVRYYRGNQPVTGASLSHTAATDAAGHYAVTAPIGAPVALSPRRAAAGRAVSALDAAWVLQAAAGRRALDATQRLVGDVTGDGAVDATDATEILRRAVGLSTALPAATQCDSEFVFMPIDAGSAPQLSGGVCRPGAIPFEPVTGAASGQDFLAAAIGDVTGNWRP